MTQMIRRAQTVPASCFTRYGGKTWKAPNKLFSAATIGNPVIVLHSEHTTSCGRRATTQAAEVRAVRANGVEVRVVVAPEWPWAVLPHHTGGPQTAQQKSSISGKASLSINEDVNVFLCSGLHFAPFICFGVFYQFLVLFTGLNRAK